jgi:MraZ protein
MADQRDPNPPEFFLGEWSRTLDERFRFSLPQGWADALVGAQTSESDGEPSAAGSGKCMLAKERPGCVSLWNSQVWESWLAAAVEVVTSKLRSGRLDQRLDNVQMLGRLLSTRHREAPIAGRGRIALPESFRSFLGVEPGEELLVVGAGVCVEVWSPNAWHAHIGEHMPSFRTLLEELAQ